MIHLNVSISGALRAFTDWKTNIIVDLTEVGYGKTSGFSYAAFVIMETLQGPILTILSLLVASKTLSTLKGFQTITTAFVDATAGAGHLSHVGWPGPGSADSENNHPRDEVDNDRGSWKKAVRFWATLGILYACLFPYPSLDIVYTAMGKEKEKVKSWRREPWALALVVSFYNSRAIIYPPQQSSCWQSGTCSTIFNQLPI